MKSWMLGRTSIFSGLGSTAGRWCLAAAVSGLAAIISLYGRGVAHARGAPSECGRAMNTPCTVCTSPSGSACSKLSGWKWGRCQIAPFSFSTCSQQTYFCTSRFDCATGNPTGTCSGGGGFDIWSGIRC